MNSNSTNDPTNVENQQNIQELENIQESEIQSNIFRLKSIDSFKIINPNIEINELNDVNLSANKNNILYNQNSEFSNCCDLATSDIGLEIDSNSEKINSNTDPNKLYEFLLNELYETIEGNSELFKNRSNVNISKPEVKYENRKTFWYNFGKNCSQIKRTMNQLKKYYEKELAVETSINEKSSLIFRGKYDSNLVANLYKKYIRSYVVCSSCKSLQTEIIRNSSNRLDYLKCLNPQCNTCKVVVKIT